MRKTNASARLFAVAAITIAFSGCPGNGSSYSESALTAATGYSIEASGQERVAAQTCFSVTNSDSFQSFEWTVADVGGSPNSSYLGCSAAEEAEFCCIFQTPGEKSVAVNAVDANGNAVALNSQFAIGLQTGSMPAIIVDVRNPDGSLEGTYSQDPLTAANIPIPSLSLGTAYTFDLSRTEANSGGGSTALTYQVSYGQGYTTLSGPETTQSFATSDFFTVSFQVTNSLGNSSIASLQIFVECADAAGHDFTLDPTKLTVTPGTQLNNYTYDFAGIRVGGAGTDSNFLYLLDLNGDGIYDTPWMNLGTPSYSGYSLYVSGSKYPTRAVSLEVWDTACNVVRAVTVDSPLPAPSAPSAADPTFPGAGLIGYDFLQADVDGLNGDMLSGINLSFLGTRPSGTDTTHMSCAYERSGTDPTNQYIAGQAVTIVVSAENAYDNPSSQLRPTHAMTLTIDGVTDRTGEVGNTHPLNTSGAYVWSTSYTTDQQQDVQQQYTFRNDQTCQLSNFSVTPSGTPPVCDGTPGSNSPSNYVATVAGDYFCPHLTNTYPLSPVVMAKIGDRGTGHFYCKIPVPNYCVLLHECVNGAWTDTGQACCSDSSCQQSPPSPPAGGGSGPGPGSGGGGGSGGSGSSPVTPNPPPPPSAPITPR